MSRAFALIKFNKSGNIYYGCYDGTCDVIYPSICTPQECYDKEDDCYKPKSYPAKSPNKEKNKIK